METMKKTAVVLLAMGAMLCTAGCRPEGKETAFLKELVPARGRVTLKGEPLARATVRFVPDVKVQGGRDAMGITDDNGVYELSTLVPGVAPKDSKGVLPGEYIVAISRVAMPDGSPIPAGMTEENEAIAKGAKQFVPSQYVDPTTSTLKARVTAAKGENNFDL